MIFVTVGTQGAFDRLTEAVEGWVARHEGVEVVAQVGPGRTDLKGIRAVRSLPPQEFRDLVRRADVVVSHAGMGTIITALEFGARIIVMPRRADLGEHRNDHQVATVEKFSQLGLVSVALDADDLCCALDRRGGAMASESVSGCASTRLLEALRGFARGDWPTGCTSGR